MRPVVSGLLVFAAVSFGASGCVVAPFIESFRQVGATKSHRIDLLSKEIVAFQTARYWQDMSTALGMVKDEQRPEVKAALLRGRDEVRVIDSKTRDVEFSPDAFEADVEIETRVHTLKNAQVTTVEEKQSWIFSLADGWKIRSLVSVLPPVDGEAVAPMPSSSHPVAPAEAAPVL